MSELMTFEAFLAELKNYTNDEKQRPFGLFLRDQVGAKRLHQHLLVQGSNGDGLCLARFLVARQKMYAGLVMSIELRHEDMELQLYCPELTVLHIPYDLMQWFTVERSPHNGKFVIHDGLLVKEEDVLAEGAASEEGEPLTSSEM